MTSINCIPNGPSLLSLGPEIFAELIDFLLAENKYALKQKIKMLKKEKKLKNVRFLCFFPY